MRKLGIHVGLARRACHERHVHDGRRGFATDAAGAIEINLAIYTSDGADWTMLVSVPEPGDNTVTAPVMHLSDFTIMIPSATGKERPSAAKAAVSRFQVKYTCERLCDFRASGNAAR